MSMDIIGALPLSMILKNLEDVELLNLIRSEVVSEKMFEKLVNDDEEFAKRIDRLMIIMEHFKEYSEANDNFYYYESEFIGKGLCMCRKYNDCNVSKLYRENKENSKEISFNVGDCCRRVQCSYCCSNKCKSSYTENSSICKRCRKMMEENNIDYCFGCEYYRRLNENGKCYTCEMRKKNNKLMGFGKFKYNTYLEVKKSERKYCSWVMKQKNTSGSLKEFKRYLKQTSSYD